MKSDFVSNLHPEQVVTTYFIVHSKQVRAKKSGDIYLSLLLADRTGQLDAKMWDGAAEVADTFDRDDFVKVKGLVQVFRNRPQMTVHKLRLAADTEVEFADYFPATEKNVEEMWGEVRSAVAGIGNSQLRALIEAFLDDEDVARRFRTAPAAKSVHHARLGGLLEHVTSLLRLARATVPNYPFVDLDLVLAAVVLHDLGKIYELSYQRAFGYTTEGQLLGHMAIVMRMIDAKAAAIPDFPPRLKMLLEHMILSHHGRYEFGSPRLPMFPEALLLHYIDDMDSKLESMRMTLAADRMIDGEWTAYNTALDRVVLKKDKFLAGPPAEQPAGEPAPAARPATPFGERLRSALESDGEQD